MSAGGHLVIECDECGEHIQVPLTPRSCEARPDGTVVVYLTPDAIAVCLHDLMHDLDEALS